MLFTNFFIEGCIDDFFLEKYFIRNVNIIDYSLAVDVNFIRMGDSCDNYEN